MSSVSAWCSRTWTSSRTSSHTPSVSEPGILVGLKIEEKLALGYLVVNVITSEIDKDLPKNLRDLGYGVTHGYQYGRDGERMTLQILTPRKYERKLIATIKELDERAFIITHEPKNINGGFWTKGVRRKRLRNYEPENVEEVLEEISEAQEPGSEKNAEKEKI